MRFIFQVLMAFLIPSKCTQEKLIVWGRPRVVRARNLGGCEFESQGLHLMPETKLREERELCYGQIASNFVISDSRYKR